MSKSFFCQTLERAGKTAAQTAAALVTANQLDWLKANWQAVLGTTCAATFASIATSFASLKMPPASSPSLVSTEAPKA